MVLRDWKNTENAKKMTLTRQGLSKNILPDRRKLPNCIKIVNSKKTGVPSFILGKCAKDKELHSSSQNRPSL